jgi:NAD(P)H dehydrogenase (quinone)
MRVLTVYAHHNPKSFCHAILERFSAGLKDAGHTNEIVDLHAIGFNPVFSGKDFPNWIDESIPADLLERTNLKKELLEAAGPVQRFFLRRQIGDKDARAIIRMLREKYPPKDVLEQQKKVARADALAFVSPLYFVGFPAILKGWIERVFTLGFAFGLKPEAWRGDLSGRLPLLKHKKALVINTTIFNEQAYQSGLGEAMKRLIDDFSLRYPGIESVEHVYFYAVHGADDAKRQSYLQRAYVLGREFSSRAGPA